MGRYPPWIPRKPKPPGKHTGGRYTHGSAGRAPDLAARLGVDYWFRSRSERNYARWLTYNGTVWQYEPRLFYFETVKSGANRAYRPDFFLPHEGAHGTFHELKGYLDRSSRIKIDRFRKFYPEYPLIVIPYAFFRDAEAKGVCRLIECWECEHHPGSLQAEVKTYVEIPATNVKKRRRR